MRPVKEPVVGGIIWMLGLAAPGDVFGRGEEADATSCKSSGGEGRVLHGGASAQGQVGGRESYRVRGAVKQFRAQLALELGNRAAHGPFPNSKLVRRLGETGLLRDGHEGGQQLERRLCSHGKPRKSYATRCGGGKR